MKSSKPIATLALATLGFFAADAPSAPAPDGAAIVVGTYDSRGVLVAYMDTPGFKEYLEAQKEDIFRAIERAKEAGDVRLVQDLEELGPAMQRRIHEQGFSTAPVDDILAHLEGKLPEIAEQAGVDLIVSRWELDYVAAGAELVDLTDTLATALGAGDETLERIHQLCAKAPVPLDELADEGGHGH